MANASVLGTISDFTIGNDITIPITKYSSEYSDTLNIYCGNTWIKRVEGLVNNQSVSFTTAELNDIYSTMSNVTGALFKFRNTTYNGENIVGTSEKYATGTIADSVKPTISSVSLTDSDAAIDNQFGGFVESQTKLYARITATAGAGSSLATYYTTIGSNTYTGAEFTSSTLTASGQVPYSVSVVDARGRVGISSGNITVIPYSSPTIPTFSVVRCNSDGTENIYGTYVKINLSAIISAANNRNTKSFKVEYKKKSDNTWTILKSYNDDYTYTLTNDVNSGFNSDYAYDFKVTATDFFGDVESLVDVPSGFALLDFKANGKGIGIGTVVNRDALQIGLPIYDRFDTVIPNGLSVYRTGGTDINPDTTIEELILTETNVPTSDTYYVKTFFFADKSTTANRTQIAYPYANDADGRASSKVFVRIYVEGLGWGVWNPIGMSARSADYSGLFDVGKLRVETGWISITPVANIPTTVSVIFANQFKAVPVVIPTVTAGVGGTQVIGCYANEISKTSADIVLTRTNAVPTNVFFMVVGEI
ncbi:MAG: DUF859 domain-containing protein [Bacilli bacterium]|nr:DUF859 domain-containing protein [Bacilli bacterium]